MFKTKQLKYSQELYFLAGAVIILIIFITSIFFILGFMISRLNTAFNPNIIQPTAVTQFNIDGFKKLGLTGE